MVETKRSIKDYQKEIDELKKEYPQYIDRINAALPLADEIIGSKDPFKMMNDIVPELDAMDAYVLGMIIGQFIKSGIDPFELK